MKIYLKNIIKIHLTKNHQYTNQFYEKTVLQVQLLNKKLIFKLLML